MVNYDGILLELWKKKGEDEQIDELICLVLTKQYTEKYKEVDPIWKDIENLQLSVGQILEAWKNMEKEGIDRVNEKNIAMGVARQITALQHKPLEMNVRGFEVQTEYKETQMMETDDTIEAVKKNSNLGKNEKNKGHQKEIEPLITTLEEGTILNYNYVLPTNGVEEYYLTVPGTAGRVIISCLDISKQLNNGFGEKGWGNQNRK